MTSFIVTTREDLRQELEEKGSTMVDGYHRWKEREGYTQGEEKKVQMEKDVS